MNEEKKPEFIFLKQEEVIAAGVLDMEKALEWNIASRGRKGKSA